MIFMTVNTEKNKKQRLFKLNLSLCFIYIYIFNVISGSGINLDSSDMKGYDSGCQVTRPDPNIRAERKRWAWSH